MVAEREEIVLLGYENFAICDWAFFSSSSSSSWEEVFEKIRREILCVRKKR